VKIVQLQSENVKRLKAVSIKPDGSLVVVKGNNGQGKSSVLDSIAYALGGKEVQPPEVIRRGQENAQVVLDLGDLVVTRRWSSNEKSQLEVKAKDGAKYSSPQAMLDKLVGRLSFDPLSFMRLEPKAQAEALRQLVGLDFTPLEAKRAKLYMERTQVNNDGKALKARVEAIPPPPEGASLQPVSIAELLAEQERLIAVREDNERKRAEAVRLVHAVENADGLVKKATADVARLEELLVHAKTHAAEMAKALEAAQTKSKHFKAIADGLVDPDTEPLKTKIREAEFTNARIQEWKGRATLAQELEQKRARSKVLAEEIQAIDAQKSGALAAAKFPVPELGFGEVGLTLNGIPLEQASSAEQLRVSLAMGLALNPKLKVLLIRDGSLLDEKALVAVGELAEQNGAQVWLERVGSGDAVGVLIEDGAVKS
jgi:DNA repair exonuclease SbcCD ATPase subunit